MTEAVQPPLRESRWQEHSLVAGVSLAHLVSHFYFMVLPPLFFYIRQDYNVSYTQLGLALSVFNLVSTIFQTPVGFLVDRAGARANLIGGLLLGALSLVIAGLVDSYWVLIAMFGVLGLANTVYHPADYAMLSRHVKSERIAQAFSVHTFAGLLGGAIAPATLLFITAQVGWRGAIIASGLFGVIAAVVLMLQRDPPVVAAARPKPGDTVHSSGWRLLMSRPILLNLLFFAMIGLIGGGLHNYMVVALHDLHNMPVALANTALSTWLFTSAAGVLLGGLILTRTKSYVAITNITLAIMGAMALALAYIDFAIIPLLVLMTFSGLAAGVMSPPRDMILREVTPPGAFGAVFGFVTNGFTITGIVAPVFYGFLMDSGNPRLVFIMVAVSCVLCALAATAAGRSGRPRIPPEPSPR